MSNTDRANVTGDSFAISSPSPTASTFNRDQVPHAGDASFGEDDEVSTRDKTGSLVPHER